MTQLRERVSQCSVEYDTQYSRHQNLQVDLESVATEEEKLSDELAALRERTSSRSRLLEQLGRQLTFYNNFLTQLKDGKKHNSGFHLQQQKEEELEKLRQELSLLDAQSVENLLASSPPDDEHKQFLEELQRFHEVNARALTDRIRNLEALLHEEQELAKRTTTTTTSPQELGIKLGKLINDVQVRLKHAREERDVDQLGEKRLLEKHRAVASKVDACRKGIARINVASLAQTRDECRATIQPKNNRGESTRSAAREYGHPDGTKSSGSSTFAEELGG